MATVGNLFVNIRAKTDGFKSDIRKATRKGGHLDFGDRLVAASRERKRLRGEIAVRQLRAANAYAMGRHKYGDKELAASQSAEARMKALPTLGKTLRSAIVGGAAIAGVAAAVGVNFAAMKLALRAGTTIVGGSVREASSAMRSGPAGRVQSALYGVDQILFSTRQGIMQLTTEWGQELRELFSVMRELGALIAGLILPALKRFNDFVQSFAGGQGSVRRGAAVSGAWVLVNQAERWTNGLFTGGN